MSDTVKVIIEIPKDYYEIIKHEVEHHLTDYMPFEIIANGTPLDSAKTEIERLKHQYTDVSGYRWWNNAIDNCLHTIRDVCDAESEDT